MNASTAEETEHWDPVRRISRPEELGAIVDDDVHAVIWDRRPPYSVLSVLEATPVGRMVGAHFDAPVGDVGARVAKLARKWGLRGTAEQHWLANDIENLAHRFAQILAIPRVFLRIEWVRDDACRKFHCDVVKARLICTYRGPGTELGPAREGGSPARIDTAPTGSAILLKGKLWPGMRNVSVLHRSPPIEATGASRLVVVINETPPNAAATS